MTEKENPRDFGSYLDRTLKVIRLNYLKAFKALGANITTEQWVILNSLYHSNGQSQTELGDASFKNPATVSRIIDLLCKKGLTERQRFDNDRKRYKIFLTSAGRELVERLYPTVKKLREKGWEGLSDQDYQDFIRIINKIFENNLSS